MTGEGLSTDVARTLAERRIREAVRGYPHAQVDIDTMLAEARADAWDSGYVAGRVSKVWPVERDQPRTTPLNPHRRNTPAQTDHRPNGCCDYHRHIADGCCHCELDNTPAQEADRG